MIPLPPLALYIHIPWCLRKCPYCDFNSHQQKDDLPEQDYIRALIADLDTDLPLAQGRKLQSIFIGGGTPSLFSPSAIDTIISSVNQRLSFSDNIEITLEANPGAAEQQRFADYRSAGVNRLSIGVQSFSDTQLHALGRVHNSGEAVQAVESARAAGFDNFNIDLMHGLPGQDSTAALNDLNQAIALQPAHISWYQLTIEPNTEFHKHPPTLPLEDTLADIQQQGQALLADSGYQQYEVSAYARGDRQSEHNLNYWLFGDYLGIGAGAHAKISSEDGIQRYWKTRRPEDYINPDTAYTVGKRSLSDEELPLEFLMNALRLNSGCDTELFSRRTGLNIDSINSQISQLQEQQLLLADSNRLQLSPTGMRYLNSVLEHFV